MALGQRCEQHMMKDCPSCNDLIEAATNAYAFLLHSYGAAWSEERGTKLPSPGYTNGDVRKFTEALEVAIVAKGGKLPKIYRKGS